jgi:DNA-binding transcriptional LysR family regulator
MRHLDNIDLRLLRIFVTLSEAGSFSAAQIVLNLSQSTLSTHIAALERFLGHSLCLRGRRGFRLTAFGEATLVATRQLFGDIEAFRARVGRHSGQLLGRVNLGIVDGVVSSAALGLQEPLQRFLSRTGEVYIDLRLGTPLQLEQWVAEGQRDVVIGPMSQKGPGVIYVPLHREANTLYCGSQHALFRVKNPTIEEIEATLFSVRSYRHLEDLHRVNHPRAGASVLQMEAQTMLVLSGHFVGFLPRHIGDDYAERGLMRALQPAKYQFMSQHFVAYRRADKDQPLVKLLVQELRKRQPVEGKPA